MIMKIVLSVLFCVLRGSDAGYEAGSDSDAGDPLSIGDLDIWPLVTPILGPLSRACAEASQEYIMLLNESLHLPLMSMSSEQRNAWRRLDSRGPLPFLNEGIMIDTREVDLCSLPLFEQLVQDQLGKRCRELPDNVRIISVPYHTAGSPGKHFIRHY